MEKIENLIQLNDLLVPYLKGRHITNNYTMPTAYIPLMDEGRLFYIDGEGLFFLVDMDNYYRFYYHLNDAEKTFSISSDKPLVAEVAFQKGKIPPEIVSGCLLKSGFTQKVKRVRMKADNDEFLVGEQSLTLTFIRVEEAGREQHGEVVEFLQENFHPLTGFLSSKEDVRISIERGEVLCAYEGMGKDLVGVLHMGINKRNTDLLHIAVAKHARKRGIGETLLLKWKDTAEKRGVENYIIWVGDDNLAARTLYEKVGFKEDGYQSLTLLHR
ncbi:MAG: GNAT family N-acetyltransferase [Anaerovoracaceae bacterium]|jgi:ribosomal protein S18 acetylase RimI-like enzyme